LTSSKKSFLFLAKTPLGENTLQIAQPYPTGAARPSRRGFSALQEGEQFSLSEPSTPTETTSKSKLFRPDRAAPVIEAILSIGHSQALRCPIEVLRQECPFCDQCLSV